MSPSGLGYDEPTPSAHNVDVLRYVIIATVACLVYDYALTLDDEKRLIWSSHLSVTKVAFFINRYMPLLATIGMMHTLVIFTSSDYEYFHTCKLRFLVFSGFILAEFLVSSFWGCKRSMLILFSSTYIVLGAVTLYFFSHFISSTEVDPRGQYHTGCILGLHSCRVCVLSLIVLVISESFAMVMIIVKAFQMPNSSIMQRIAEDGIIYLLIVTGASIANIVILTRTPPSLCDFLLASRSALQSICCNHLFFRIRIRSSDSDSSDNPPRILRASTRTPLRSKTPDDSTRSNEMALEFVSTSSQVEIEIEVA